MIKITDSVQKLPSPRDIVLLAFFLHDSKWGEKIRGDERRFLEIAKEFRRRGVRIYTIEHEPLQEYFLKEPVYIPITTGASVKNKSKMRELIRLLRMLIFVITVVLRLKFNVIYAHNQDFENVFFATIVKILSRKPLAVVIDLIPGDEQNKVKSGRRGSLALLPARVRELLWKVCLRNADTCIAVSRYVAMKAIEELNLRRVYICGNGVDINKFRPENRPKAYHAAFLGRIDFTQKGIDTLLKAWALVSSELPNGKLVLIGGGSEEAYRQLKLMLNKLKLSNNVIVTGFLSDEVLIKKLNESRIFVFPSRFEGFGLAVLEAMACGLPCILSDIPVFRELHESAAILIKPGDYKLLASTIINLLQNRELLKKLRNKSREHALNYTWSKVSALEFKVLYNLLTQKVT